MKALIKRHWVLLLSIVYFLSPIDLLPDFLVWLLGPAIIIDDAAVLIGAIIHAIWHEYRLRSKQQTSKTVLDGQSI